MLRFLDRVSAKRSAALAPGRPLLGLLALAALIAVSAVAGYLFSARQWGIARAELGTLTQRNGALQQELEELAQRLIDAELARKVDREAMAVLRNSMQNAHGEMEELRKEISFYKSLMAPSSLANGLSIAELELIEAEAPRTYDYRILLTQKTERPNWVSGNLLMQVAGRRQGQKRSFALPELTDLKTYPLPFRFRYFQNLSGTLTLPEGFRPERLLAIAEQRNGEAETLKQSFAWKVSEG